MEDTSPLRFLQQEVARLRHENRELKDELSTLRSSVRALNALQDIIQRLKPTTDIITFLDDVLASALAVLSATDGSLLLLDEETDEFVFAIVHGEARARLTGHRIPTGKGIAGWVAARKKPLIVDDVRADPRFSPDVDQTFGFTTRSLACVPLIDGDRTLGVIEAINKLSDREFTEEDHDLLVVLAQLASVALIRAESFEKAQEA